MAVKRTQVSAALYVISIPLPNHFCKQPAIKETINSATAHSCLGIHTQYIPACGTPTASKNEAKERKL